MTLKNDRFLRALSREPVDVTPVWMMRQAGRYLPEYRATRKQAGDFLALCKTPELACEVTLQPLRRYSFDAAILFSDILTIPDALGQGLYFSEGEGPKFHKIIKTTTDVEHLPEINIASELAYVTDAVSLIRKELNGKVPLIGFSGSPWTLATYMIEGGSSKDFRMVKQFMYDNPEAMHLLLSKLADAVTDYLNAQIQAINIGDARRRVGDRVALQGNMDPSVLYASPSVIRAEVGNIIQNYGEGSGHVFNLGHGISPGVSPENVKIFVDTVHELSAQYHT